MNNITKWGCAQEHKSKRAKEQKRTGLMTYALVTCALMICLILPLSAFAEEKTSIDTLRQLGRAFAEIAEKASPAVVTIKVEKRITVEYPSFQSPFGDQFFDPFSDDFFDYFFRRRSPRVQPRQTPKREYRQWGQASGFIVSPDGYILTNNHLVGDVDEVKVTLTDGRVFTAKMVGTDPDSDVAVVKIDANNLQHLEMGDSDKIEVGEWVIAIGNPFGLSHTVTAGIVSAKGRSGLGISTYEDFIQTDAAINPGNSGGPLVNLNGKVVGVNTAIIGPGANIGIGLAIPINLARSSYEQITAKGVVTRGFLGIVTDDLTPEQAGKFGIKDKDLKGVVVPEVIVNSAAEKAGIRPGDVIVEVNDQAVTKAAELRRKIAAMEPGAKVKVIVIREGKRKELTVKLDKRPSAEALAAAKSTQEVEKLGISVENLTEDLTKRYGYEGLKGVVVTEVQPETPAAMAGIESGSLIQEVNRQPIENTEQFNEEVKKALAEGRISLLLRFENSSKFVVLELPKD
jgi:serine protease Do